MHQRRVCANFRQLGLPPYAAPEDQLGKRPPAVWRLPIGKSSLYCARGNALGPGRGVIASRN